MLLGNTHTHSIKSDGRRTSKRMIKEYRKKGYDFVFMTDHRNKEKPFGYPQVSGITVIEGCEVSSGEHYTYAEGEEEVIRIKNHPNRYRDPIEEVEKWNLFEATEHARLQKKYLKCKGNYPVFSDDAHSLHDVGRVGILVDVDKNASKDEILRAIKEGNFRLYARNLIT